MVESYDEYLKSNWWLQKRDYILQIRQKVCLICGSKKKIVVHHLNYFNFRNERDRDLILVCWNCHTDIHKDQCKKPEYNFSKTSKEDLEY